MIEGAGAALCASVLGFVHSLLAGNGIARRPGPRVVTLFHERRELELARSDRTFAERIKIG